MSFQYMPWYTGDYLRDTRHLDCSEHGIYCLLLMHCWDQKGPLPLDERKLFGISNARSGSEVEALRRVLNEFFVRMDDGWYNKRITEEVAKAEALSSSRREAGYKSAETRKKLRLASVEQVLSKCSTSAQHLSEDLDLRPIPIKPLGAGAPCEAKSASPVPESSQAKQDRERRASARYVLQHLNEKAGRNFQMEPATLKPIEARLKKYSRGDLLRVVNMQVEEWGDDERMYKYLRPSTLFGASNFADYFGLLTKGVTENG